tara:strand:+ start:656 stop:1609 length:954 start_codon:yes stop_codon:yes gene_type:complete
MNLQQYISGLKNGDRSILAKAITLIESELKNDQNKAIQLIDKCIPLSGKSKRIGISGTPGAGKSTFIDSLGRLLVEKHKIAVLTIDPSSTISKGSILGDKTRMEFLANSKSAFIRPSPSRGELGGITKNTRNTIILCETAGFDVIIIETVGVGQSETLINHITDISLYLTLVDNGDELQFIKKGTLELSDIILLNKSDQNQKKSKQIKHSLENSLTSTQKQKPQIVFTCSAIKGTNIKKIWSYIMHQLKKEQAKINISRDEQDIFWINRIIEDELKAIVKNNNTIQKKIHKIYETQTKNPQKLAIEIVKNLIKEDWR